MATSRPSGAAWHASGRTDVERNCYQPQRKQRPHLPLCLRQYSYWWTSGWRRRTGPFGPRRWPEHSPAEAEVDSEPCECQKNQIPKYLPVLFVRRSRQEEGNINMLRMFVQSQTIKRAHSFPLPVGNLPIRQVRLQRTHSGSCRCGLCYACTIII